MNENLRNLKCCLSQKGYLKVHSGLHTHRILKYLTLSGTFTGILRTGSEFIKWSLEFLIWTKGSDKTANSNCTDGSFCRTLLSPNPA